MSTGIFLSTFDKTIDKQGRVCVPIEFRSVLLKHRADNPNVGFIAFRSYVTKTIECFSFERMEKLSEQMENQSTSFLDAFNTERDAFASSVFADSHLITFDMDEGRIKLPTHLLEHAEITKNLLFVGKGATFQIWSPELFQIHQQNARQQLQAKMKI